MCVDPRKNMTTLEYHYALLKSGYYNKILGFALRLPDTIRNVIETAANWYEVILEYPSPALKRKPITVRFRDGTTSTVAKRGDLAKIVEEYRAKRALLKAKSLYGVDLSPLAEISKVQLRRDLLPRGLQRPRC